MKEDLKLWKVELDEDNYENVVLRRKRALRQFIHEDCGGEIQVDDLVLLIKKESKHKKAMDEKTDSVMYGNRTLFAVTFVEECDDYNIISIAPVEIRIRDERGYEL